MDFINDISFEIGGKLVVLIEHQSTINPNMALRFLHYISEIYKTIIDSKNLYSTRKVKIPWPEFFVLYNGTEPYPDEVKLKLSDLFEKPYELGLPEKAFPLLELEVKVININEGRNEEILKRCKKLFEYSAFIAKKRSFYEELGKNEEAVTAAIKYCAKHGILKEFLEIHGREVLNMVITEWNTEDCIAVRCEEAREDALKEGREEGIGLGMEKQNQYVLELIQQGLTTEEIKLRLTHKEN